MKVFRQGDVILVPVGEIPSGSVIEPDKGRVILAYGEVTGHAHALPLGFAKQYQAGERVFVEVTAKAELRHEEHAPLQIPEGKYEKLIAREHTPGGERRVID